MEATGAADQADGAGAGVIKVIPEDVDISVISIEEDSVAAELIEGAVLDGAGFCIAEVACSGAGGGPVTTQQGLTILHEGTFGVLEGESLEVDVLHGLVGGSLEGDELCEVSGFDGGGRQVEIRGRDEVERGGGGVVEPF